MPKVGVIMGSDSDLPMMQDALSVLEAFGVEYTVTICSAHRLPRETAAYAAGAQEAGYEAIIAAAGGAAHLPGVIASYTVLPVIGVPAASGALNGLDALYAIVQMPRGIPVATVAVDGSANAALLAVEIRAVKYGALREALLNYRRRMAADVSQKNARLDEIGVKAYLQTK
jgi:phosphoribosylaminoimidazole carboxylase PurE protein